MSENIKQAALMPDGVTLDQVIMAYIDGIMGVIPPLANPAFQSMAQINGKWLRVSVNITHEWLEELPPEVMAIMPTAGSEGAH